MKKIEKLFLYLFFLITPIAVSWFSLNGKTIDLRTMRTISFFSLSIIVCNFLQGNRWLRYFSIWCVATWWIHYFLPTSGDLFLSTLLSSLVLYIGVKHLLKRGYFSQEGLFTLIGSLVILQLGWMMLQSFNIDPLFLPVNVKGETVKVPMHIVGWSGNTCLLGLFLAINSFLLLACFRFKKFPIFFFLTAIGCLVVKNATTIIALSIGVMTYLLLKHKNRKALFGSLAVFIGLGFFIYFIKHPNFDRIPIWQGTWKVIKQCPILGSGLDSFKYFGISISANVPVREAHNDYLQLWVETGGIGLILFLGFIVERIVYFVRKGFDHEQLCMFCSLIVFLVSCFTVFPMHIAQLGFCAIVILSCLEYSYET